VREEDRGSAGPDHTHANNNCRIYNKVEFLMVSSGLPLSTLVRRAAKNQTTGRVKGGDSIGIVDQE
jgi:hypothetical protein